MMGEGDTANAARRAAWPRPLALHLMSGLMSQSATALAGAPPPANPLDPAAMQLFMTKAAQQLGEPDRALLEVQETVGAMLRGIELYQRHPYRRPGTDRPVVWRHGAARLIDFGGAGRPALAIPSLVNRSDVLDLMAGNSLMRWLSAEGAVRPLLLDWGAPGVAERNFGLAEYITSPVKAALNHVCHMAGGPVTVIAYCMGGDLALAAAQLYAEQIRDLALLATPWDFTADLSQGGRLFAESMPQWQPVLETQGEMPVDLLQCFFAALDPGLAGRKFARFSTLDMESPEAVQFVALEDWVNDGVPLTPRVALETLGGWYRDNGPARGRWLVEGQAIEPARVTCRSLAAIPGRDRIVPPASAEPLAAALPDVTILRPDAGHIGMVTGSRARQKLWEPLQAWLAA